ncbi:MAG: cell division topological specificity factor MinE [Legionellales bacterium]|nr:cell division topological specificity factor MinE [Legionellales bacterium]
MPAKTKTPSPAAIAKERLQIIVSHESVATDDPDFIRKLQDEMLQVICKYINISREHVRVQLEQRGEHSVLELNVTLDESEVAPKVKAPEAPKKVEATAATSTAPPAKAPAEEKSSAL